jgi:DNA-directed RNA polymerase subunit beta
VLAISDESKKPIIGKELLDYNNYGQVRTNLYDNVLKSVETAYPIENERYSLKLTNLKYDPKDHYTLKDQKKAILGDSTLSRKLSGTWELYDKETGGLVSKSKPRAIINVPYLTDRGTYIRNGTEYTISKQLRLRPGAYTRKTDAGIFETQFNTKQKTGPGFRIFMDPETSVFYMKHKTNKIPLYPVLQRMGYPDQSMQAAWGREILKANKAMENKPHAINWINKFAPKEEDLQKNAGGVLVPDILQKMADMDQMVKYDQSEAIRNNLNDYFNKMELDETTTATTLGKPYKNVTPDAMIASTSKILNLARGKGYTDDRDSLEFQTLHDAADFLTQKIRDDQNGVSRRLLWHLARKKGDMASIRSGALDDHVDHLFNNAGVSSVIEEINPFDPYDQNQRVIRMGEGGIPSIDSVPKESRAVQPSFFNYIDAVRSPESMKIGVDMKMARNVRRGPDNMLYTQFINAKTGQPEWVSMRKAARSVIAFPESYKTKDKYVMTMDRSKGQRYLDRKEVQYILPNDDDVFSEGANLVPVKSGVKAMRLLMGAKMAAQALPLVNREAPLVQNLQNRDTGQSVEKFLGKHMGAVNADGRGVVKRVTKDYIEVDYGKGPIKHEIHDNTPFARKTFIRNVPTVKAGDTVKKGQTLAYSNYTNSDGVTALGTNLRVAMMTHHGKNYEDAVTVSESAAKKMTSEHMYQEQLDDDPTLTVDKKRFLALYPGKYSPEQMKTIADNGMAKPGTVLKYGDPIFLVSRIRPPSRETLGRKTIADESVIWKHKFPGVVVESSESEKKGPTMFIRANVPFQDGDKLSGRYGNKGVAAEVVPDSQMPTDAQGRPFDVMMAPEGIISRTNPSQAMEMQLAKIAEKTGKAYVLPGFTDDPDEDMSEFVEKELTKHGLASTEEVYDPVLRKNVPDIYTGGMYLYKLHHTSEGKLKARSTAGYTYDEQPAKGGKTGAKHIGDMEWQALLGHGAKEIIKDLKITKGQKNDDYWRQVKLGQTPATPSTPVVYDKFRSMIQAAGIELRDTGTSDNIFAMTNNKVHKLTGNREIKTANTFEAATFKPIPGGLFDPVATGSEQNGNKWSYIKLPEPMLNPIMADPVRHILGLKKKDLEAILSGQMEAPNGGTGSRAIHDMLKRIDIKQEKASAMDTIKGGARSKRDAAVKRYNYLTAMEKQKVTPEDFLWDRVPVLPPKYRPITRDTKMTTVADPNYLYKALIESKQDLAELQSEGIGGKPLARARLQMYQNLNALIGLTDPVQPDLKNKRVEGILSQITGKGSPKSSFVQRRVIGTNIDISGLGVITPNPNLKLNQIGLPINKAWDLYEPFVIRKMVRSGYPAKQAVQLISKRDKAAFVHLQDVVKERPIIYNRAPSLHKYSVLAAWPVLVKGDALQISPSIVKPLGADFDGDTASFTVPASKKAVDEAVGKMMPDKLLLSERGDKPHFVPSNEYVKGLHLATRAAQKKPTRRFKTRADAMRAYQSGEIKVDDPIEIEQ